MIEDNDNRSLKERTAQGLFWGFLSSGGMQLLNLVIGIFLARLLSPAEYGIVGMLSIFSLIAINLQDSGFGVALINIKNIKHNDYNAVFWFNLAMTLSLYVLLFACAPLIARFYHQPCLTTLSRFLFIGFVFSALGVVPGAVLNRNLRVKEKAIINLLALVISGIVGVTMAFKGYSYWSLAVQQVLYNVVTCFGRYICARWFPSFKVDFTPVKKMFSFSYKVLLTNILTNINNNVLTVIFGRLFPAQDVGNYTQANKWNTMANWTVSGTLSQVAQPVLTRITDDKERLRRVYSKLMRFTGFMSFPAMLGLSLVAPQFILVAIGDKWEQSIPLLQILCVSGAFIPFYTVYQHLFLSLGKSGIYMWLNLAQILLVITTVLICYPWGITAMVVAFACVNILWLLAWQFFARRLIGYGYRNMVRDMLPFIAITLCALAVTALVTMPLSDIRLLLVARIVIAALLYVLVMKLLNARILNECIDFIRFRNRKNND